MALRGGLAWVAVGIALIAGAAAGYAAALEGWGPAGRATALIIQTMQQERAAHEAELASLRAQQDRQTKDQIEARDVQQHERAIHKEVVEATLTQYEQARARLDTLEAEKLIQIAENQSMTQAIHERDQALAVLREQVAFYEQLLPAGPPGVVSVRQFDASVSSGLLRYRVLLTRSADDGNGMFTGRLQFTARGLQAGRMVTVELTPATVADATIQDDRSLDVALRLYQRAEGVLGLPPDLSLRSVTVNVLQGQTVRAKREVRPPF